MAVVISSDLVLAANAGNVQPLTHARIMYQNLVPDSSVVGTTEAAGFEADSVKSYATYERWAPTAVPATITFDFGSLVDFDYVFIASHNLGTTASTLVPEYSADAESWTALESDRIPSNDNAIAFLFDSVNARYMRIRITAATTPPVVGIVMCGEALAMQRPIYGGHSPVTLSRKTEIRPSQSVNGQWLGRSIVRQGYQADYQWQHLTAAWYRENFDPFVRAARTQPFGIAWRPETFPNEVAYVWTSSDIRPSNMGIKDYMSVNLSVTGYDAGDL